MLALLLAASSVLTTPSSKPCPADLVVQSPLVTVVRDSCVSANDRDRATL